MSKKSFLSLLFALFIPFLYAHATPQEATAPQAPLWGGHMVRFHLGAANDFHAWAHERGLFLKAEPFFELGYAYGWVLKNTFYLSAGLSWLITYPRNFLPLAGFFQPPLVLWYTPITSLQVGAILPHEILLTVGLVYLWALEGSVRFPIGKHLFFENKFIFWLDRWVGGNGLDNLHASIGMGYHF